MKNHTLTSSQNGFSMIEVLVSLFVLATGILGVTSLQSTSLKNSATSIARTQAAYMSYEILDRIRANPSQYYTVAADSIPEHVNCLTQSCSAAELMAFDLAEWKCTFHSFHSNDACSGFTSNANSTLSTDSVLLNGDGIVNCADSAGEKQCSVTVSWKESDGSSAGVKTYSYAVTVIL